MTPFTEQARRYAQYHNAPLLWYTHIAGTLLILLSLCILLGFIHLVIPNVIDIKFSGLAVFVLLIYYMRLNWLIALTLLPVFILLLWISGLFNHAGPNAFSLWSFLLTFIMGCLLQFGGHLIHGNQPAFVDNYKNIFATPMFITAEIFFMTGKMQRLKQKIYEEKTDGFEQEKKRDH